MRTQAPRVRKNAKTSTRIALSFTTSPPGLRGPRHGRPRLGAPLVAASLLLGLWGARTIRRAGTNIDPRKPATALVVTGPFRYTRNPLYLSLTLLYLGIAALVNALWPLVLLPVVLVVIRRWVIAREELYLKRKFGEAYRKYKATVRHWL